MKWSTVLLTASIGTRATADHVSPSVVLLNTMSLDEQLVRKRQSCQATKTRPPASTSADGKGLERSPPAMPWLLTAEMVTAVLQVAPPSVDLKERMLELLAL